jgi:hypothetical protein
MIYLDEIAGLFRSRLPESAPPTDGADGLFLFYAVLARAIHLAAEILAVRRWI